MLQAGPQLVLPLSVHALGACSQCMLSVYALSACSVHALSACSRCMLSVHALSACSLCFPSQCMQPCSLAARHMPMQRVPVQQPAACICSYLSAPLHTQAQDSSSAPRTCPCKGYRPQCILPPTVKQRCLKGTSK